MNLDAEWIRTGFVLLAYGAWVAVPFFGHVRAFVNGRKSRMEEREPYEADDVPERSIRRRKQGGYYWTDKSRRVERLAEEIERAMLNSIATGQPLGNEMKLEIINKAKEIQREAAEMERYDG